jgi:acyl carrier protein
MNTDFVTHVRAAIQEAGGDAVQKRIEWKHSLVLDLGFDSLKLAMLSLALESQLGCAIVLDGWIGSHPDPHELTVGSLCEYLKTNVESHEHPVAPQ